MSYTIQDARDDLYNSDLLSESSGSKVFSRARADVALRRAFDEFALRTKMLHTSVDVVTSSGVRYVDPKDNAPRFLPGKRYSTPFIGDSSGTADDWYDIDVVDFGTLRDNYRFNTQNDAPRSCAWLGDRVYLHPVPDAAYTLTFPYEDTLVDYTPGTRGTYASGTTYDYLDCVTHTNGLDYQYTSTTSASGNLPTDTAYWKQRDTLTIVDPFTTVINIPEQYARLVVSSGGLYNLVRGVPGHEQWPSAGQAFDELIRNATGSAVETGVYIPNSAGFI